MILIIFDNQSRCTGKWSTGCKLYTCCTCYIVTADYFDATIWVWYLTFDFWYSVFLKESLVVCLRWKNNFKNVPLTAVKTSSNQDSSMSKCYAIWDTSPRRYCGRSSIETNRSSAISNAFMHLLKFNLWNHSSCDRRGSHTYQRWPESWKRSWEKFIYMAI